jgi:hypothetical protein
VNIVIDKDVIRIQLSSLEKILTFHKSFKIPILQIREISYWIEFAIFIRISEQEVGCGTKR